MADTAPTTGPWTRYQAAPQAPQQGPWTRYQAAPQPQAPAGRSVPEGWQQVGSFGQDGGIYRRPNGEFSAVSSGVSTNDQAAIERLMQGEDYRAILQDSVDQDIISQHPVAARGNEVIRGIPFVGSYADEVADTLSPSGGDGMRALHGAMERQNPIETTALNVTGGVAAAVPMAMAGGPAVLNALSGKAPAIQLGIGAGLGAIGGGTEGLVYGYGEGEGEGRAHAAAQHGIMGAVMGGGLGAFLPMVGKGVNALAGKLSPRTDLRQIANALAISIPAANVVRNALRAGDGTASRNALAAAGPDAMLADAGTAARDLLDAAAQTGGNAGQIVTNAVDARTQAGTERMRQRLDDVLGAPRGERELITEASEATRGARSTAYDAAYSQPIDYASEQGIALEGLMKRLPPSAIERANAIMRARGEQSAQIMAQVADDGSVTLMRLPDVRQWHYIMQGLDDVIANTDGMGAMRGQTTLGSSYQGLRSQISSNLGDAVPAFREAQGIASDTIRRQGAIETGYDLLRANTRREDVANFVSSASPSELMAARQGIRSFIDEQMANVRRTISDPDDTTRQGIQLLRDLSSEASRTKLRMVLGNSADDLLREVDEVAGAFNLRASIATNSRTAVRQSIQAGVREGNGYDGALRTLASGEPVNAGKRLIQALTGETPEARQVRDAGLFEEIARALTEKRGPEAVRALDIINQAISGQRQLSADQAQAVADALLGVYGTALHPAGEGGRQLLGQ